MRGGEAKEESGVWNKIGNGMERGYLTLDTDIVAFNMFDLESHRIRSILEKLIDDCFLID